MHSDQKSLDIRTASGSNQCLINTFQSQLKASNQKNGSAGIHEWVLKVLPHTFPLKKYKNQRLDFLDLDCESTLKVFKILFLPQASLDTIVQASYSCW